VPDAALFTTAASAETCKISLSQTIIDCGNWPRAAASDAAEHLSNPKYVPRHPKLANPF
jgi:hypothetical protein